MAPTILLILAVLCFLLAVFGVAPGGLLMVPLGLTFMCGAFLFGQPWPWRRAG